MKKLLTLALAFLLLNCSPAFADITTNLVGYWALNEGSGTTPQDSSGSGCHGTFANAPDCSSEETARRHVSRRHTECGNKMSEKKEAADSVADHKQRAI